MSSLLKEAIVDAKALREAALKNAETTIIDKYSDEVRDTLEKLLEQDELPAPEEAGDLGDPLEELGLSPEDPAAGLEAPAEDQEEVIEGLNETYSISHYIRRHFLYPHYVNQKKQTEKVNEAIIRLA